MVKDEETQEGEKGSGTPMKVDTDSVKVLRVETDQTDGLAPEAKVSPKVSPTPSLGDPQRPLLSTPTTPMTEQKEHKLVPQMQVTLSSRKEDNGEDVAMQGLTHSVVMINDESESESNNREEGKSANFFVQEWKAFKSEMKTKLSDNEKRITVLDFDGIAKEWKYDPKTSSDEHWKNQKKKKEGECCSPLFYTVLIGIIFTLMPNCAIALDLKAAYEYLGGEWYVKKEGYTDLALLDRNCTGKEEILPTPCCRNTTSFFGVKQIECFEQDIIWGSLTLVLLFLPGVFWSLGIFIQFATYLRKKNPAIYDKKRCLFFFFAPLAGLAIVTFPFQLIVVSIIFCFNNQDNWAILTSKVGIAEGLFNAHFQYLLQLFIFFVRSDRHPSLFQYGAAFGSLLFLVWSRIESLLVDREGHHMSPGQKAWWVCRYGPMFLFNSAFKVGSISLIIAMLRYNAIWLYGTIVLTWLLLQFLFNEQYLPRKYYYLFIGAGMHAVSIAHIQEEVKMVHAKPDSRKNTLWVTRLTDIELKTNMWFQNIMWFSLNATVIIALTIAAEVKPDAEIPIFWPIFTETVAFQDNKVFKGLYLITPMLIIAGILSLILLWTKDFKATDKEEIGRALRAKTVTVKDISKTAARKDATDGVQRQDTMLGEVVGWRHDWGNCQGCNQPPPAWHSFTYAGSATEVRI